MVVFSNSVFHGKVKGLEKDFPCPELLAVKYLLHEGE